MEPQAARSKAVVSALGSIKWKPDFLGVMYSLCVHAVFGQPEQVIEPLLCRRWRQRSATGHFQPYLQLGAVEVPVEAFTENEWISVVSDMKSEYLLSCLAEEQVDSLERQYVERRAECTPVRTPQVGQLAPTEAALKGLRVIIDSGLLDFVFSPGYRTPTGRSVLIIPDSHPWQLRCLDFQGDDCEIGKDSRICNVRRVDAFWETPYNMLSGGTVIECGRCDSFGASFAKRYRRRGSSK